MWEYRRVDTECLVIVPNSFSVPAALFNPLNTELNPICQ